MLGIWQQTGVECSKRTGGDRAFIHLLPPSAKTNATIAAILREYVSSQPVSFSPLASFVFRERNQVKCRIYF